MTKYNVAFCGTPDICLSTIEALLDHPLVNLKRIISMPSRPAGRGMKLIDPEVVKFANSKNIPVSQTANLNADEELIAILKNKEIDFLVVFAFAQFLKQATLDLPKLGCLNIHTSLLPQYRGAAPIQYAIKDGLKETGVTIQKMVLKMDAGNILYQKKINIEESETTLSLTSKLKKLSAEAITEFFYAFEQSEITETAQDESQVSFAPTIKKPEAYLDFTQNTAIDALNKIKAFNPWPFVQVLLNGKRFKIKEAKLSSKNMNIEPGHLVIKDKKIYIGCQDQSIELLVGQMEGKPARSSQELINGFNFTETALDQIT